MTPLVYNLGRQMSHISGNDDIQVHKIYAVIVKSISKAIKKTSAPNTSKAKLDISIVVLEQCLVERAQNVNGNHKRPHRLRRDIFGRTTCFLLEKSSRILQELTLFLT